MTITVPLFPLNTVLFPGMPLNLHIFEARYKLMVQHCRTHQKPFGVVLIKQGIEALGPLPNPHGNGCLAHITQIEPLAEGRMNIRAVGTERFHIQSLDRQNRYLSGNITLTPLEPATHDHEHNVQQLRRWLIRYISLATTSNDNTLDLTSIPSSPADLAHLAAYLLDIPPTEKQELLTLTSADELIHQVYRLYRREIHLLPALLDHTSSDALSPFSTN